MKVRGGRAAVLVLVALTLAACQQYGSRVVLGTDDPLTAGEPATARGHIWFSDGETDPRAEVRRPPRR